MGQRVDRDTELGRDAHFGEGDGKATLADVVTGGDDPGTDRLVQGAVPGGRRSIELRRDSRICRWAAMGVGQQIEMAAGEVLARDAEEQ